MSGETESYPDFDFNYREICPNCGSTLDNDSECPNCEADFDRCECCVKYFLMEDLVFDYDQNMYFCKKCWEEAKGEENGRK